MNFLAIFKHGGPMMWPLFGLSMLGFVFFLERALFLHKGQIGTAKFIEGIKNLARKRRVMEALTVCEETPGPVASVVKAALLHYREDESRLRGAIQAMALVEIPTLERRLGTIAVIAKVAPLLGLLGTVLSLYNGFDLMSGKHSYADASTFPESSPQPSFQPPPAWQSPSWRIWPIIFSMAACARWCMTWNGSAMKCCNSCWWTSRARPPPPWNQVPESDVTKMNAA